jgi:predicted DNA-binding transcriptional regulator YafY
MNAGNHRAAYARFQHIAAALTVRKRTTRSMLAEELEVSVKTVQRDMEFMRDRLNLPIAADDRGCYFSDEVKLCRCCARRLRSC